MIAHLDKEFIKLRPTKLWARIIAYLFFEGRPATTRGRWLNSIVFSLFRVFTLLPSLAKVKSPIFIVGMGRSGTTALGAVLSIHRQLGYLNEPKALWYFTNQDDDVIGSYGNHPGRYTLSPEDVDAKTIKRINNVYSIFLKLTRSKRILDKYPEMLFRIEYVKRIFPDAKFIFIARNGIDNCLSVEKWCERHRRIIGEESHDWWGVDSRKWQLLNAQIVNKHVDLLDENGEAYEFTDDLNRAVVEWIVTMREWLVAVKLYPKDVLKVHYEQIGEQTDSVLREIFSFIDVDTQDNIAFKYAQEKFVLSTRNNSVIGLDERIRPAFDRTLKDLGYLPSFDDSQLGSMS